MLNTNINYYQLLGIHPGAAPEELQKAYESKILELNMQKISNIEIYQTAYYTLSDVRRRKAYDDSIGLLHKNKIPVFKRLILILGRFIFTFMDIIAELLWSFVIVIVLSLAGYVYCYYKEHGAFVVKDIITSIDSIYVYIGIVTLALSIIFYMLHPAIRRKNRQLKYSLRKYK